MKRSSAKASRPASYGDGGRGGTGTDGYGPGGPTPGPGVPARSSRGQEVLGASVLVLLLAAVCGYRLAILAGDPAPPGSDGGNWLALSVELFGARVRAAEAAYPPVFPFVVWLARGLLPPLTALKAAGILSSVSVSVPAYLMLRTSLRPWLAAVVASVAVVTTYAGEVFAWGGYPQHLGTAFLLLALYSFLAGLENGRVAWFLAAGAAAGLTAGTHTLAAAELAVATVAVLALALCRSILTGRRPQVGRLLSGAFAWLGVLAVLLAALSPVYFRMFSLLAGNPVNPHGLSVFAALSSLGSWHADDYQWLVLGAVCIPTALWLALSRGVAAADAAVGAFAGAGVILLAQSEIRTVLLLQVGILLAAGALLGAVDAPKPSPGQGLPRLAAGAVLAAIVVALAATGLRGGRAAVDWYRVVDRPALAALDWLRERRLEVPGDGRVLTGETERGGIYGWWVEGYAGLPAYMAIDPVWVSFSDEKRQTAVANHMMAGDAPASEVRRLADDHDIRYALIDTRDAARAVPALLEAGFSLSVAIDRMVVLARPGDEEGP